MKIYLTYLTVIPTIETYVYKCKKYKISNIYKNESGREKKKKKVISRVHSIYFSSFFFLSQPFFFIRSCVIFHVVFQSSRLVTILSPDGHCVLRWVMVENMSVCHSFFSIFSISHKDWVTTELFMNFLNNWNLNKLSNHIILCMKEYHFRYQFSWQKNVSFNRLLVKCFASKISN